MHHIAKGHAQAGNRVVSVIGARSANLLLFEEELRKFSHEVLVATDDGSRGEKSFVTQILQKRLEEDPQIKEVVAVGPVPMISGAGYRAQRRLAERQSVPPGGGRGQYRLPRHPGIQYGFGRAPRGQRQELSDRAGCGGAAHQASVPSAPPLIITVGIHPQAAIALVNFFASLQVLHPAMIVRIFSLFLPSRAFFFFLSPKLPD